MFTRDNLPGIALVGLCLVVIVALLAEIFGDVTWEFNGPSWLGNAIAIAGIGLIGYMSWRAWGRRLLGKGNDDQTWPKNDVRNKKRGDKSGNDPDAPA